MKKTVYTSIIIALAAAMLFSCKRNGLSDLSAGEGEFKATIAGLSETKTALQDNYKVFWQDGDLIDINGEKYVAAPSKSDSTQAIFSAVANAAAKTDAYYAFYPGDIAAGGANGILPACVDFSPEASYLPMFATSSSKLLEFKNICAAIEVRVSPSVMVKTITVTADKALNGEFSVVDGVAVMTKTEGLEDADKSVTLDCNPGVQGTTFYIPIPAASYDSLKVTLTKIDDTFETMTAAISPVIMTVNTVYPFNFRRDGSYLLNKKVILKIL